MATNLPKLDLDIPEGTDVVNRDDKGTHGWSFNDLMSKIEANAVTVKDFAQTIFGAITHAKTVTLNHTIALLGKDSGDTARNLAKTDLVSGEEQSIFGDPLQRSVIDATLGPTRIIDLNTEASEKLNTYMRKGVFFGDGTGAAVSWLRIAAIQGSNGRGSVTMPIANTGGNNAEFALIQLSRDAGGARGSITLKHGSQLGVSIQAIRLVFDTDVDPTKTFIDLLVDDDAAPGLNLVWVYAEFGSEGEAPEALYLAARVNRQLNEPVAVRRALEVLVDSYGGANENPWATRAEKELAEMSARK